MDFTILETNHLGGYEYYRIPGIIFTEKGSLIACYECRQEKQDWGNIDIAMRRSTNGGKTWSDRVILVPGSGETANNPIMFSDEGQIILMYQIMYRRTFLRRSFDDGLTWGAPEEITRMIKSPGYDYTIIACGPGHGTVLSNGRYLTPVWLCANPDNPQAHRPSIISTLYSDDRGSTWQLGELIRNEELHNPSETTCAEADGQVLLNIRHEGPNHRRILAYSSDGISRWHNFRYADELPDPICSGSMICVNGSLYFVNCRNETHRHNLTLQRSSDGGNTWQVLQELSVQGGYSDIAASSGTLYVFYEQGTTYNPPWGSNLENLSLITIPL